MVKSDYVQIWQSLMSGTQSSSELCVTAIWSSVELNFSQAKPKGAVDIKFNLDVLLAGLLLHGVPTVSSLPQYLSTFEKVFYSVVFLSIPLFLFVCLFYCTI